MDNNDFITWLGDRLDKIEGKLDEGRDRLSSVDVTLAKQASDLEYHIKRTDLLEAQVSRVADEVTPIKEHVQKFRGIVWFLVALAGVGSALATLKGLIP
jgi:hypothetical protein